MANILRYKPADDAFDDLFRGFFMRPMSFDGPQQDIQIKVDVNEDDKAYTVHADIPRVKKEDIQATLTSVRWPSVRKNESEEKRTLGGDKYLIKKPTCGWLFLEYLNCV